MENEYGGLKIEAWRADTKVYGNHSGSVFMPNNRRSMSLKAYLVHKLRKQLYAKAVISGIEVTPCYHEAE